MDLRELVHGLTVNARWGKRTLTVEATRTDLIVEIDFSFIEDPMSRYRLQVIPEYAAADPHRVVALLATWLEAGPKNGRTLAIGAAEFGGTEPT